MKSKIKLSKEDIIFLLVVTCIALVVIFIEKLMSVSNQTLNSESVPTERVDILQEMYLENSKDIVREVNLIVSNCIEYQYMRDEYKDFSYPSVNKYLDKYKLREFSDFSDEQINIEVDTFIYCFEKDFASIDDLSILLKKREFIKNEIVKLNE